MEFETAFMGELLDINAFDQPGVELGKQFTFGLMGRAGYEQYRDQFEAYEKKHEAARSQEGVAGRPRPAPLLRLGGLGAAGLSSRAGFSAGAVGGAALTAFPRRK